MRDKNRIKPFMKELATIWEEECPDWRFGQFITNVLGALPYDVFFCEDSELLDEIEKFFKRKPLDDNLKELIRNQDWRKSSGTKD